MRIAILASNFIRLPPEASFVPEGYSGAPEHIMSVITEALVLRGHEVTLFASGDTKTQARLISVTSKATATDPQIGIRHHIDYEYLLAFRCYQLAQKGNFDIIHSIFDTRSALFASFSSVPTVSTLHSPLAGIKKDILSKVSYTQWYVAISNSQRLPLPHLRYIDTIYHGIDLASFPLSEGEKSYVILAGRMVENKGITVAIEASGKAGVPLYLLGEPQKNDPYWVDHVAPYIDRMHVHHEGFVERETLIRKYQQARALLFPIQWEEPFGLVMIEAMACGTPVIAYNRGSVPEVVQDGVTGFIIDPDNTDRPGKGSWVIKKQGVEGLVEAIQRIGEIDRRACRNHVKAHFTVEKMVDSYEKVYAKIIASKGDALQS
jgi:glycosyltransferase involved in cell wall biosynthesis